MMISLSWMVYLSASPARWIDKWFEKMIWLYNTIDMYLILCIMNMDNEYKSVIIFVMVISVFMIIFMIIFMMVLLFMDGTISIRDMDCINMHDNGCVNSWMVFYYHILILIIHIIMAIWWWIFIWIIIWIYNIERLLIIITGYWMNIIVKNGTMIMINHWKMVNSG